MDRSLILEMLEPRLLLSSSAWQGFADPLNSDLGLAQVAVQVHDVDGDGRPDILTSESDSLHVLYGSDPSITFHGSGDFKNTYFQDDSDPTVPPEDRMGHPTNDIDGSVSFFETYMQPRVSGPFVMGQFGGTEGLDVATVVEGGVSVLLDTVIPGTRHNFYLAATTNVNSAKLGIPHRIEDIAVGALGGDGNDDVVLATSTDGDEAVVVMINSGGGTFSVLQLATYGGAISDVEVADINGDGRNDILALDYDNNALLLYIADTTGFASYNAAQANPTRPQFIPLSPNPASPVNDGPARIVRVDTNNDGTRDIVIINELGDQGDVALNRHLTLLKVENGAIGAPRHLNIAVAGELVIPRSITFDDYDGDGNQDLAIGNSINSQVIVMLGDGQGGFARGPSLSLGVDVPIQDLAQPFEVVNNKLQSIDMNKDGLPDIVALTPDGIHTFINAGHESPDGSYDPFVRLQEQPEDSYYGYTSGTSVERPTTRLPYQSPSSAQIADLNGDGWGDLVVGNGAVGTFDVYLTTGPQSYTDPVSYSVGAPVTFVGAADLDGDGLVDAYAAAGSSLYWFLNQGGGVLAAAGSMNLSAPLAAGVSANFDHDAAGLADLVVGTSAGAVTLLQNASTAGNVEFSTATVLTLPYAVTDMELADFDADSSTAADDLVVGGAGLPRALFNNGTGGFVEVIVGTGIQSTRVTAGDFDGDGDDDIAAYNPATQSVVLFSNAVGTFSVAQTVALAGPLVDMNATDLDRDGVEDLLVLREQNAVPTTTYLVQYLSTPGSVSLGSPSRMDLQTRGVALAVSDLNDDRYSDAVVVGPSGGIDLLYFHSSEFILIEWSDISTMTKKPETVAAGDIDGDGDADLVVGNARGNSISVFLNQGGKFVSPVEYAGPGLPVSGVTLADLDGDGLPEIVAHYEGSAQIGVHRNLGSGVFSAAPQMLSIPAISDPKGEIVAADFNGDALGDLVVVNDGTTIVVLMNTTSGATLTFGAEAFSFLGAPVSAGVGRIGGTDDPLDIVVAVDDPANLNDGLVVLAGDGLGGFSILAQIDTANPVHAEIADVDGDGRGEVVSATALGVVSVFDVDDNGQSALLSQFNLGVDVASFRAALLDGDARADLVFLSPTSTSPIRTLISAGGGTFQAARTYDPGNKPVSFVLANVVGSALPDLIAIGGSGPAVAAGTGTTFGVASQYSVLRMDNPDSVVDVYYYTQYDAQPVHLAGPFPVGDAGDHFIWNSGNPRQAGGHYVTLGPKDYLYEGGNEVYFRIVLSQKEDDGSITKVWDDGITPIRIGPGGVWNGLGGEIQLDAGINPYFLVQAIYPDSSDPYNTRFNEGGANKLGMTDMNYDRATDLVTMSEDGQVFHIFYGMQDYVESGWTGPLFWEAPNSDWGEFVPYIIYDVDEFDRDANGTRESFEAVDSGARVYMRNDLPQLYFPLGDVGMGDTFRGLSIDFPEGPNAYGDRDYFRFVMADDPGPNDTIDITWTSSSGHNLLAYWGRSPNNINNAFTSVDSGHLRISAAAAGIGADDVIYLRIVGATSTDVVSSYQIAFTPWGPAGSDGVPDDRAAAQVLPAVNGPNVFTGYNIDSNSDADWFVFNLDHVGAVDETVRIDFDSAAGGDLNLAVYQYSGGSTATFTRVSNSATGNSDQVSLFGAQPGQVYIQVTGSTNLKGYSLSVNLPGITPDWAEDNDSMAQAYYLGPIAGRFDLSQLSLEPGDEDYFHFYLAQSFSSDKTIKVSYDPRLGDLTAALLNRAGGTVASSGAAKTDPVSGQRYVTITLSASAESIFERGEFYLRVAGSAGAVGTPDYTISFDLEPNHAPSFDVGDLDPNFNVWGWFDDMFAARYSDTPGNYLNAIYPFGIPGTKDDQGNPTSYDPVPLPQPNGTTDRDRLYPASFPPILPDQRLESLYQQLGIDPRFDLEWYPKATDIVMAEGRPMSSEDTSGLLFLWQNPQRQFWGHNPKNDLTNVQGGGLDDRDRLKSLNDIRVLETAPLGFRAPLHPEELGIDWYLPPPAEMTDTSTPNYVRIYDLDEDGDLDIIVSNETEDRIDIFRNYSWAPLATVPQQFPGATEGFFANPLSFRQAGNQKYHLIIDNLGDAPGQFWLGDINTYSVPGTTPEFFEDIVLCTPGSSEVWIIEGAVDANGNWLVASIKSYNVGFQPTFVNVVELDSFMLGDLPVDTPQNDLFYEPGLGLDPQNTDGDWLYHDEPEIVVVDRLNGYISVLRGNGEKDGPTFENAWVQTVGYRPTDAAFGDFNNDQFPDAVVSNSQAGSSSVSFLFGNQTRPDSRPYGSYTIDWNSPADITRDPTVDWYNVTNAWMDMTNDWGTLQYDRSWTLTDYIQALAVETGLWNGDSQVDLAVLDKYTGQLRVSFNRGTTPAIEVDKWLWGFLWNPWFPAPAQQYDRPNTLAALDTLEIRWRRYDPSSSVNGTTQSEQIYWDLDNDPSNGYGGTINGVTYDGLIATSYVDPVTGDGVTVTADGAVITPDETPFDRYVYIRWTPAFYLAGKQVWIVATYTTPYGTDFDYQNPERPVTVSDGTPAILLDNIPAASTAGSTVSVGFEYLEPAATDAAMNATVNIYYDYDLNPWNADQPFLAQDPATLNGPHLIATNNPDLLAANPGLIQITLPFGLSDTPLAGRYTFNWTVPSSTAGKSIYLFGVITTDPQYAGEVGPEDFTRIFDYWRGDYTGAPMQVYPDPVVNGAGGASDVANVTGGLQRLIDILDYPQNTTLGANLPTIIQWWNAGLTTDSPTVSLFYDTDRNSDNGVNWIARNIAADSAPTQYEIDYPGNFVWTVPTNLVEKTFYIGAALVDPASGGIVYDYMQYPVTVTSPWRWDGTENPAFSAAHMESWIVSADFNLDGKLDLAATSALNGDLIVYRGDGAGGFSLAAIKQLNLAAYAVAVGDFWSPDGGRDGLPDLVVSVGPNSASPSTPAQLWVFPNLSSAGGSILFGNPIKTNLFDNVVASTDAATFLASTDTWQTGQFDPTSSDFNHDGIPDLIALNYASFNGSSYTPATPLMIVRYGDGRGGFLPVDTNPVFVQDSQNPDIIRYAGRQAVITDVNDDGWLDVVVLVDDTYLSSVRSGTSSSGHIGDESFTVFLNDRTGKLGRFFPLPAGRVLSHPREPGTFITTDLAIDPMDSHLLTIATGDFNGDGIVDLVMAGHEEDRLHIPPLSYYTVYVYLGQNDGRYGKPLGSGDDPAGGERFMYTDWHFTESNPSWISVADFDRDGIQDFIVLCRDDDAAVFYKGHGDGTFENGIAYNAGKFPVNAAAGDFDGDGWTDLFVSNFADRGISALINSERQYTPVIILEEPDFLFAPLNTPFDIRWRDADDDSDALITLYWDTDDNPANGGLHTIASGIAESLDGVEAPDVYQWTVSGLGLTVGSRIFLSASVTDGVNTTWNTLASPITIIDSNQAFIALRNFSAPLTRYYQDGIPIAWFDNDNDDSDTVEIYYNTTPSETGATLLKGGISEDDPNNTLLWDASLKPGDTPESHLGQSLFFGAKIYNGHEQAWDWTDDAILIAARPEIGALTVDAAKSGYPLIQTHVSARDQDSDFSVVFFADADADPTNGFTVFETVNSAPAGSLTAFTGNWGDTPEEQAQLRALIGQQRYLGAYIESPDGRIYATPQLVTIGAVQPVIDLHPLSTGVLEYGKDVLLSWTDAYDPGNAQINLYWDDDPTFDDAGDPTPKVLINPTPIPEDPDGAGDTYTWANAMPTAGTIWIFGQISGGGASDVSVLGGAAGITVSRPPLIGAVDLSATSVYPGEGITVTVQYGDPDSTMTMSASYVRTVGGPIAITLPQTAFGPTDYFDTTQFTWQVPVAAQFSQGVIHVNVTSPDGLSGSGDSAEITVADTPTITLGTLPASVELGAVFDITWTDRDRDSSDTIELYFDFNGVWGDGDETLINAAPIQEDADGTSGSYAWNVDPAQYPTMASMPSLYLYAVITDPTAPAGNVFGSMRVRSAALEIVDTPTVQINDSTLAREVIRGEPIGIGYTATDLDDNANVVLFADADTIWGNGNEQAISPALPEDAANMGAIYDWTPAASLVGQSWYIVARASDGTREAVDYGDADPSTPGLDPVYVADRPHIALANFAAGQTVKAGLDTLNIAYTLSDLDNPTVTLSVYWDLNTDPTNPADEKDVTWGVISENQTIASVNGSVNWAVPVSLFNRDVYIYATVTDNGPLVPHASSDYTDNSVHVIKGNQPVLIAQREVDRVLISFYDTGVTSADQSTISIAWSQAEYNRFTTDVLVVGSGKNDRVIKAITFYNFPDNVGVVIEGQGGEIKTINDKRTGNYTPISFIASQVQVKTVDIRGALAGFDINALSLGANWLLPTDIDGDGASSDKVGLYLASPLPTTSVSVRGSTAGDIVTSNLKTLTLADVTGGADISVHGDLQKLSAANITGSTLLRAFSGQIGTAQFNSWQSGLIQAEDIKTVKSGGLLGADIRVLSGFRTALSITSSGDVTGDIDVNRDLKSLAVKKASILSSNIRVGGLLSNVTVGQDIVATNIDAGRLSRITVSGMVLSDGTNPYKIVAHAGTFKIKDSAHPLTTISPAAGAEWDNGLVRLEIEE